MEEVLTWTVPFIWVISTVVLPIAHIGGAHAATIVTLKRVCRTRSFHTVIIETDPLAKLYRYTINKHTFISKLLLLPTDKPHDHLLISALRIGPVYVYICMHGCMCACARVCVCACMCACVCYCCNWVHCLFSRPLTHDLLSFLSLFWLGKSFTALTGKVVKTCALGQHASSLPQCPSRSGWVVGSCCLCARHAFDFREEP